MTTLTRFDHLVLTVADIAASCRFYEGVLGMRAEQFQAADGSTRYALYFGNQKINLHQLGQEFEPNARMAVPGSGDLCFVTDEPLEDWLTHLSHLDIAPLEGPVPRSGAMGSMMSIYLRDPDGNLLEIARYDR